MIFRFDTSAAPKHFPAKCAAVRRRKCDHSIVRRFLSDNAGATAIEYAMIASGVAAAIAAVVFGLGSEVKNTLYDKIAALL